MSHPNPHGLVDEVLAVLEPFAKAIDRYEGHCRKFKFPPLSGDQTSPRVSIGDLRRARDLHTRLAQGGGEDGLRGKLTEEQWMALSASFGPIIKACFPEESANTRARFADALCEQVRKREHWFSGSGHRQEGAWVPISDATMTWVAAQQQREGEWQDIASAPRNGTAFDAWVPDAFGGKRMIGLSFNRRGQLRQHGLLTPAELPRWPTHWRPLPAPPIAQEEPSS